MLGSIYFSEPSELHSSTLVYVVSLFIYKSGGCSAKKV